MSQDSGEVAWTFDTVDSADLWGNPDVNSGGGSWYPPAIDTATGRVHWAVANPGRAPGALDWYRQAAPHELYDHDLTSVLLVDVGKGSSARRVLVASGKGGFVIGHDVDSGAILWTTRVGVHENDQMTLLTGPTRVLPGGFGGVLTPPAAADGVVYVAVINAPSQYVPDDPNSIGATFGRMDGQAVAIDAASGQILWDVPVPGDPFGGMTVVNDLVFTATFQAKVNAVPPPPKRTTVPTAVEKLKSVIVMPLTSGADEPGVGSKNTVTVSLAFGSALN